MICTLERLGIKISRILELYKEISGNGQRFIDEIFEAEIYKWACPQLTIVDIGAYEGEFGYYCYNFARKIYSIEPDPRPYKILQKHIKDYELDKMQCFPIAISGKSGKRMFNPSGYGGSTLLGPDGGGEGIIEVDSLTLKDFFEENNIHHVDILKIDAESSEYEIFKTPDFKNVAERIVTIIGESHGGVDQLKEVFEPLEFNIISKESIFVAKR